MLASRVLPPILRSPPPPPVATFFNIPRRYVKSNMNVGEDASRSPMEDVRSSRNLRKSNRAHDMRSSSISSQGQHANDEQLPSPAVSSPRATKKRLVSLDDLAGDSNDEDHLMSHTRKSSADISVSSAGSVDSSGHVCLCQPEPKIPRPRNGMSFILPNVKKTNQNGLHDTRQRNLSLSTSMLHQPLILCSFYPLSAASSALHRRQQSRACKSRDLKDHRRAVEV